MKRYGFTSFLITLGITFAVCFAMSDFALAAGSIADPTSMHAGTLAMAHPFADAGSTMAGLGILSWAYWHPVHKPSNAGAAPAVQFKINITTADCPNGIIDYSPQGGARLVAVEDCRAQCQASNDPELVKLGASLKTYYAFAPALADASLSAEQQFNIKTNTTYVHGIARWAGRMVNIFTANTPDPTGKEMWITGQPVDDHGSFDSAITLADVGTELVNAMKRSALRL